MVSRRAQPDSLVDVCDTPLCELSAPLLVQSSILGERVYFVANDRQAAEVWAKDGIPYSPEEVALLWKLYEAVTPEVWAERLKLIHAAKKAFIGSTIIDVGGT